MRSAVATNRSGFTMIELLVVMTIIAILMSVSFVVYGAAMENARATATRATIVNIQTAVDSKTAALARRNIKSLAQTFEASYNQGGNASPNQRISPEVAEILVRKHLYIESMPSRLEDLWGYDLTPGNADDSPLWAVWKRTINKAAGSNVVTDANPRPTGHRRDLENSELLYLFLTQGANFGEGAFLVDKIRSSHVKDTPVDLNGDGTIDGGNGISEFFDEWGSPLRFYGWTHRLIRPGGNGAAIDQALFAQTAHVLMTGQSPPASPSPYPANVYNHPLNQDPDDFTGALSVAQTATGLMTAPFQIDLNVGPGVAIVTCPAFDEVNYHALDTRSLSLVVSAGPDRRLGLFEPTEATQPERRTAEPDTTQLDAIVDNITTRN